MAAPRQLHLLVPQLFGPELSGVNGKLAASELEILLARSARSACATNTNTLLFELFGVEADSERLPIAPLTYASDTGSAPPGWCLRADPVYMRADSDRVFLMGNDFLSVHPHEAEALASELAPLLQEYGGQLSTPSPKRWYLDLPRDPGIYGQDLQSVRGCDIHRFLASESQGSENAKLWRRILNEVQMVLHGSPVNTAREARGELPINSLWFWGGGRLPAAGAQHLVQACTNNIVGLALAQLTITPHTPAPAIASDWLQEAITPGEHLVLLEGAANSIDTHYELDDTAQQQMAISCLNKDWFAPLLTSLKSRALTDLYIYPGNGTVFHSTAASISHWWKRPRRLASYQISGADTDSAAPIVSR